MLDWSRRVDDLAFHLATQYRMEDRVALEILLSALIATWLNEPHQARLFIECDYDWRLPRYRSISEIRFLLAKSLRLRVVSTFDGASRPIDEQQAERRTDQLRALTADILQDPAGTRPINPPSWVEPPA